MLALHVTLPTLTHSTAYGPPQAGGPLSTGRGHTEAQGKKDSWVPPDMALGSQILPQTEGILVSQALELT